MGDGVLEAVGTSVGVDVDVGDGVVVGVAVPVGVGVADWESSSAEIWGGVTAAASADGSVPSPPNPDRINAVAIIKIARMATIPTASGWRPSAALTAKTCCLTESKRRRGSVGGDESNPSSGIVVDDGIAFGCDLPGVIEGNLIVSLSSVDNRKAFAISVTVLNRSLGWRLNARNMASATKPGTCGLISWGRRSSSSRILMHASGGGNPATAKYNVAPMP